MFLGFFFWGGGSEFSFCFQGYEVGVLLSLQKHRKNESDPKITQKRIKNDSKMGSGVTFESLLGHLGVGLHESLLSHSWVTLILSMFCIVRRTPTS